MGSEEENREEGELSEEGELPDDEPAEEVPAQEDAQKPTSDAKQQADAPQQQAAAHSGRTTSGPSAQQEPQQQQQPVALSRPRAEPQPQQQQLQRAREPHARERSRERGRGAADHHHASGRGGSDHDAARQKDREREAEKQKAEREKQELHKELDRLTYDVSFQEVRGNFVGSCQDLRTAIKKLDKLLRRVKKKREDDVELYPSAFNYSSRIINALKHVVVICSTGLGQLADMEPANALMRTAVNYRHDVFSLNHKQELEQQLRDSKEFRHLFTDRDRGRNSSKANGAAAAGGAGGSVAGGSSRREGDQAEQRQPLQRGQPPQQQQGQPPHSARSDGMQTSASKDEAVSEASHAAAGATSSRGPAGLSSGAAAAAVTGEHAPGSPIGAASAVRSGGGPTPVAGPSPAADGQTSATPFAGPIYDAAGAASAAAASAAGGGGGAGGWGSSTGAGGGITSSRRGAVNAGAPGLIKIVVNSTSVTPPVAAAAAGSGTGAGAGSSSGLKRPMPQIQDLDAEDDDEQQAAKRVRQQAPPAAAAGDAAGAGTANGLPLSELPEVAAALHNPGQLQVVLQDLLGSHRLCLVLDLDHTLVNSAKFSEVDADWEYRLEQLAAEQLSRPKESRDLHRLARVAMWTKLRPGVRDFLRRAAERFELWIYTAGNKAYADAMVELLDPSGQYFGSRVIAQGVPTGPDESPADAVVFKRLMQGLEGREPVVVIVDDSSAVWPHDRRNLFVVERYIYFPSSRRRFGMQGKSLLEIERDECASRGMLMTALRVFEHLHDLVFARMRSAPPAAMPDAAAGWDVRNVMAAEKRQVLSGVHLVFSRVIPLESNPRQHPLWQLAEQFGATCGEQCNDTTTHVVATHGGTEKVMWAKQNNKHVVSPAWLECSCILWQRANEDKFPTPL